MRIGRVTQVSAAAAIVAASAGAGAAAQQPLAALSDPGFESSADGALPTGWWLIGGDKGYAAAPDRDRPHAGRGSIRLGRSGGTGPADAFGSVATYLDASSYRGRRVRFSAAVRTRQPAGRVGLVLRVDRAAGTGAFDNMANRPIRAEDWQVHAIEADVAPDARGIFLGLIVAGEGTAWMDSVRIEDIGPALAAPTVVGTSGKRPREAPGPNDRPPRVISEVGRTNLSAFARAYGAVRNFHPSPQALQADWDRLAVRGVEAVEGARSPAALADALNHTFQPVAPTFRAWAAAAAPVAQVPTRPAEGAQALGWRHEAHPGVKGASPSPRVPERSGTFTAADIHVETLPGGVTIHVPLKVWEGGGTAAPGGTQPAAEELLSGHNRSTRLAAVISAWSALRDFFPYFDVVEVDWPEQLQRALRRAATNADDVAFVDTLREMVAALDDGHGSVQYWRARTGRLPLAFEVVEGRLLVVGADPGAAPGVRIGDEVESIGGRPVAALMLERTKLTSGSPQWAGEMAEYELLAGVPGTTAELGVTGADGRQRTITLPYRDGSDARLSEEPRPEPFAQLEGGILYVDLTRMDSAALRDRLAELAAARGIVFDVRGYPRNSPWYLAHLTDAPIRSPSFDVPVMTRPNLAGLRYDAHPWQIPATAPRFTRNVVFLADERAISFSESVLGTVNNNKLARIVGSPTAGANGNLVELVLPGGYLVTWTGLKVVNQDGSQHHIVGIAPDVPVRPTIAGVRAGRDEVLERGLKLVREGTDQR
jgi:C-terminal processing protease CtpA/Prc